MFDLVKNVFQSLLALHRQSEINMNKSESLLWGHQYLADFPRGRSSLLFWETALHIPLLCSFQRTCHWKEISPPSVLVFFILLLLHLKSLLVTKQLGTGERNLLYHGNGDKEKKKSDHLWMQRWCFSSIPLTGFVPCVKPKQGTSKEILSLLCPTSVDSNIQMTFYKINRGQGLALERWQWHPRQDHGERGQTRRKLAVLGFPSCSVPLPPWAVEFFPYWTSDGRRGESGTVYMQALSSQGPSKPFCQCLS